MGHIKIINFPFGTNGKLMVLGVPIFKHFRVLYHQGTVSSFYCESVLKERRLRWYGHVERSNGAVKTAFDIQVNGKRGPGRPKMTWKQLTERDRREWKLSAIDPHDRDTWRSGVRSAMRAASQSPGRGPTVVDMAPIPAR